MAGDTANSFLNDFAGPNRARHYFFRWARYQQAVAEGHDAVNGTIGALLENDGSLAINQTVDKFVRSSPPIEIAAMSAKRALGSRLAVTLA